jgi:hypothetical protein
MMRTRAAAGVAVLLVAAVLTADSQGQTPTAGNAGSRDPLAQLLQQRYDAARAEAEAVAALYRQGRVLVYDLLAAQQRLAIAGEEMATMPAERLKYVQAALDAAKANEDIIRARRQAGLESPQAMYRATALRQTAEIEVGSAQVAAGQATAAEVKSALPKLLAERHESTAKEVAAFDGQYRAGLVPLEHVIDAHLRLARSSAELYSSPAERIKNLDQSLEQARQIEALAQAKLDAEIEPRHALLQATQLRLDLEIEKVQLQLAAAKPAPGAARSRDFDILSDKLQSLLAERYKAASAELQAKRELYHTGRVELADLAAAVRRQVHAGMGLAQTPAEEITHQQAAVRATKEFESQVRGRVEQGLETQAALQFALAQRLTAEIGLVRAQRAAEPK